MPASPKQRAFARDHQPFCIARHPRRRDTVFNHCPLPSTGLNAKSCQNKCQESISRMTSGTSAASALFRRKSTTRHQSGGTNPRSSRVARHGTGWASANRLLRARLLAPSDLAERTQDRRASLVSGRVGHPQTAYFVRGSLCPPIWRNEPKASRHPHCHGTKSNPYHTRPAQRGKSTPVPPCLRAFVPLLPTS
jgi:hypothetical protein